MCKKRTWFCCGPDYASVSPPGCHCRSVVTHRHGSLCSRSLEPFSSNHLTCRAACACGKCESRPCTDVGLVVDRSSINVISSQLGSVYSAREAGTIFPPGVHIFLFSKQTFWFLVFRSIGSLSEAPSIGLVTLRRFSSSCRSPATLHTMSIALPAAVCQHHRHAPFQPLPRCKSLPLRA